MFGEEESENANGGGERMDEDGEDGADGLGTVQGEFTMARPGQDDGQCSFLIRRRVGWRLKCYQGE